MYTTSAGSARSEIGLANNTDSTTIVSTFETGGDGAHDHGDTATAVGATHRPYAAVGTLQYPDV